MHRIGRLVITLTIGLAMGAVSGASAADPPCPSGMPKVGHLGFEQIDCDCTVRLDMKSGISRWQFRAEPVVRDVDTDGPAAAALKDGDVITSIDGALITTADGGRRFGQIKPGQSVTLTVRRNGRAQTVHVVAGSVCANEALGNMTPMVLPGFATWSEFAPPAAPTPAPSATPPTPPSPPRPMSAPRVVTIQAAPGAPAAPATPRTAPVPYMAETLPRGWIGVALSCSQCGGELAGGETTPSWTFGTMPEIYFVDPYSPAARAGLRRGDVLTHIDGVALTTEDGGRRFGAVRPGQNVKWTYRRNGASQTVSVTAAVRPEERRVSMRDFADRIRAAQASGELERMTADVDMLESELARMSALGDMTAPTDRRLRYAGAVGGSDVEVRGMGNVVVDESGEELVITTRDATIRIRPNGKVVVKKAEPKK